MHEDGGGVVVTRLRRMFGRGRGPVRGGLAGVLGRRFLGGLGQGEAGPSIAAHRAGTPVEVRLCKRASSITRKTTK